MATACLHRRDAAVGPPPVKLAVVLLQLKAFLANVYPFPIRLSWSHTIGSYRITLTPEDFDLSEHLRKPMFLSATLPMVQTFI